MGVGWLFLGGDGWVDIEMGTDECWVNPWSIAGSHANTSIFFFKKLDQPFLLLRRQLSPYLKELPVGTTNDYLI